MSIMTPAQMAVENLRGNVYKMTREYMTREEAVSLLRKLTSQDFGDDPDAWESWLREHTDVFQFADFEKVKNERGDTETESE